MATQRYASCRNGALLLCAGFTVMAAATVAMGRAAAAGDALLATYEPHALATETDAMAAVAGLERVLQDSRDIYLKARLDYRIGVIQFRVGMLTQAMERFQRLSHARECPALVRLASRNMVAQIHRLTGAHEEALQAFSEVISFLEQHPFEGAGLERVVAHLMYSALVSRAEIYEVDRRYGDSIAEYRRLLTTLSPVPGGGSTEPHLPVVLDRLSQLYLKMGVIDAYLDVAGTLVQDHAAYGRVPLVCLERECVRWLTAGRVRREFPEGSLDAPVNAIAALREMDAQALSDPLLCALRTLSERYPDGVGGILIGYHYAWALDVSGAEDEAAAALHRVFSADIDRLGGSPGEQAVAALTQDYARIQYAIIATEQSDYRKALQVLSTLRPDPNRPHIDTLAQSIRASIETLRKEVPRHGTP